MPTISNAVPWSTDVLINGRPKVIFTPLPKERALNGAKPWSWNIVKKQSVSFILSGVKAVSAGRGPSRFNPFFIIVLITGDIIFFSSFPNSPPSPA